MISWSYLAKWAAVIGGGLGIVIVLTVWSGQTNLREVFSGQLPLSIAVALSGNSLAFLSMLLLFCTIGIAIALWQNLPQISAGAAWLAIGGALAYMMYTSRFSIGPLLIPSTVLFIIAGMLALWQRQQ